MYLDFILTYLDHVMQLLNTSGAMQVTMKLFRDDNRHELIHIHSTAIKSNEIKSISNK